VKSRLLLALCLCCAARLRAADTNAPAAPCLLTPPAPGTPRINGPDIFGVRSGSPFLYTIPATGDRPMTFSAKNLPRD
jgi:alpha-galactosidase